MPERSSEFVEIFNDAAHAAQYTDGPSKFVPGFESVHRMASVLLREHAPETAYVMVHGAGGGLEMEALARAHPGWRFLGVDPAKPMLEEAQARLKDFAARTEFHHGYASDAPAGPFDAGTSFLTLHFLRADERLETVKDIVRRLEPGAPFVAVHCSFPQDAPSRQLWLARHRDYSVASGMPADLAEKGRQDISEHLHVLNPASDAQILREAGLTDVTEFYAAFTWRGWIGRAA